MITHLLDQNLLVLKKIQIPNQSEIRSHKRPFKSHWNK